MKSLKCLMSCWGENWRWGTSRSFYSWEIINLSCNHRINLNLGMWSRFESRIMLNQIYASSFPWSWYQKGYRQIKRCKNIICLALWLEKCTTIGNAMFYRFRWYTFIRNIIQAIFASLKITILMREPWLYKVTLRYGMFFDSKGTPKIVENT